VTHNVFATLRRIFAHVKLEKRLDGVGVVDADVREFHLGSNKGFEFCRRDFSQALEPGHLRVPQLCHGIIPFRLGVAINR